jgi:3D (Asp-Asp-Asp) domain-containing protein
MTKAEKKLNCPNGVTALGNVPKAGVTVACDPSLLGKTIKLKGVGKRTCQDTGGAIKGHKIDLYVGTIAEAMKWGVRQIEYEVL